MLIKIIMMVLVMLASCPASIPTNGGVDYKDLTQDERMQYLRMAYMVNHSYENTADSLKNISGDLEVVEHSERGNLDYTLFKEKKNSKYYLVFNGTELHSFGDAMDDHAVFNNGSIPKQFTDAADVLNNCLTAHPNRAMTVIGHSLGGSLAQFASMQTSNPNVTCVTYNTLGLPTQSLNKEQSTRSKNAIAHIIHDDDMVKDLPLVQMEGKIVRLSENPTNILSTFIHGMENDGIENIKSTVLSYSRNMDYMNENLGESDAKISNTGRGSISALLAYNNIDLMNMQKNIDQTLNLYDLNSLGPIPAAISGTAIGIGAAGAEILDVEGKRRKIENAIDKHAIVSSGPVLAGISGAIIGGSVLLKEYCVSKIYKKINLNPNHLTHAVGLYTLRKRHSIKRILSLMAKRNEYIQEETEVTQVAEHSQGNKTYYRILVELPREEISDLRRLQCKQDVPSYFQNDLERKKEFDELSKMASASDGGPGAEFVQSGYVQSILAYNDEIENVRQEYVEVVNDLKEKHCLGSLRLYIQIGIPKSHRDGYMGKVNLKWFDSLLDIHDEMVDALKQVKDAASAEKAVSKLEILSEKMSMEKSSANLGIGAMMSLEMEIRKFANQIISSKIKKLNEQKMRIIENDYYGSVSLKDTLKTGGSMVGLRLL